MPRLTIVRKIDAPVDFVFKTVSDIREFSRVIPHITEVEFLTESKTGLGTRFREIRVANGKEMPTELEVTEYVENEKVRMVADSHGTIWDTLFSVQAGDVKAGNHETTLTMTMDARAHQWLPRIMNPFIMGMVRKAVAKDIDMVKRHCESVSRSSVEIQ